MSHQVSSYEYLIHEPIISVPKKEVIMPRFKNILKAGQHSKNRKSKLLEEELIINKMLKKLSQQELDAIQVTNNALTVKKFNQLKNKMRKTAQSNQNSKILNDFFVQRNSHRWSSIGNYRNNDSQIIDISKKFQIKIATKVSTIQEAKQINKNKQKYRKWLNSWHNNSTNSINYKKMSYVIEKARKTQQWKDAVKNQQKIQKMMHSTMYDKVWNTKQKSIYRSKKKICNPFQLSKII